MSATNVPQNLQTTTGPGTSDGYLPFADVSGYVQGARAWLLDSLGGSKVECFLSVVDIPGRRVGVTFTSSLPYNYGRSDVSSYPILSVLVQESPGLSNQPSRVDNKSDTAPLSISPRSATTTGSNVTFTANADVTWLLASPSLGSINSSTGVYTPGAAGTDVVIASSNAYPWIKAYATVTKTALFMALSSGVVPTSIIGQGSLTAETGQSIVSGRTTSAYVTLVDGSLSLLRPAKIRVEQQGIRIEKSAANVALSTQQIGNSDWLTIATGAAPTAVLNTTEAPAPDGTFTASKLSFPITNTVRSYSLWYQQGLGTQNSASIYLRAPAGQAFDVLVTDSGEANSTVCHLTDQWQRFSIGGVNAAGGGQVLIGYFDAAGFSQPNTVLTDVPRDVYAWGLMVESTRFPTSYWPIGTQMFLGSDKIDTDWAGIFSGAGSFTTGTVTGPDGTANIGGTFVMNAPGGGYSVLRQSLSVVAGQPYTVSVWAKGALGTEILYLNGNDGTASYPSVGLSLTTSWARYKVTFTPANSGFGFTDIGCNTGVGNAPVGSQTVYLAQAQMNPGNQPAAYFTVGASVPTARGDDTITFANPLTMNPATFRFSLTMQPQDTWLKVFVQGGSVIGLAAAQQFVTAANSWSIATVNVSTGNMQLVAWDNADGERAWLQTDFPWPGGGGGNLPIYCLARDIAGSPATLTLSPGSGAGSYVGSGTGLITTQWGTVQLADPFYGWVRQILVDNT